MDTVGQPEFTTQGKVIAFLRDVLGYVYLGNWKDRANNRNIEREFVEDWLASQEHDDNLIAKALFELEKAAALVGSKTLYGVNHDIYEMLRYGVKVQPDVGENNVTVWLIDWENPDNKSFFRGGGGHGRWRKYQAPRPRRVRQRHRIGCAGTQTLHGVGSRRDTTKPGQPKKRHSSGRSSLPCNW